MFAGALAFGPREAWSASNRAVALSRFRSDPPRTSRFRVRFALGAWSTHASALRDRPALDVPGRGTSSVLLSRSETRGDDRGRHVIRRGIPLLEYDSVPGDGPVKGLILASRYMVPALRCWPSWLPTCGHEGPRS